MALFHAEPERYEAQLSDKIAIFEQTFAAQLPHAPEVFTSPRSHYRMRAEFRIWQDGDRCYYAMFNPGDPKTPVEITTFDVANERINEVMVALLDEVHAHPEIMRRKLFQVEFLTSTTGDVLVSMIYHRKLDEQWTELAKTLESKLGIYLIGRSRKQRIVVSRDYVNETLHTDAGAFDYKQYENSFTQPNAVVCQKMINWSLKQAHHLNGDLLELYCGIGNFTLPLAKGFDHVVASEIAKKSVAAAKENLAANNLQNVHVGRMASEDFSDCFNHGKAHKQLPNFADYQLNTLFVDPPRAGLDEETIALARGFEHIIYISCNPTTAAANCQALADTHEITEVAVFDQFPYTHHLECGLLLTRRAPSR